MSAAKYMKHFRKIVKLALAHRWITEDPFAFYKNTAKPKEREFLAQDELDRWQESEIRGRLFPCSGAGNEMCLQSLVCRQEEFSLKNSSFFDNQ
nr:phage integrase SAM-like domain-containing protein [Parapedobacter composti]